MKSSERSSVTIPKKIFTIFISIIFLAIQLSFYYILLFGINQLKDDYYNVYRGIYYTVEGIGILIVLIIYNKDINFSYKLSWSIFILLFPFFGTMCYLLFGNSRVLSTKKQLKIDKYISYNDLAEKEFPAMDLEFKKIATSLLKDASTMPYTNTKLKFFSDALDKHKEMLNDLNNAKTFIYMEFFILSDGKLLDEVYDILKVKGSLGVEIKILYDDVGSKRCLKRKTIKKFREIPNLKMVSYEPLGINVNPAINYRDHRKIVIIDSKIAYCGGDNLADEYVHYIKRFGFWRDNALKVEGEAVYEYLVLFSYMWYMSAKEEIDVMAHHVDYKVESNDVLIPFGDGPLNKNNPSYELFMNLINSAKKTLYISTPYFIIDKEMINAISRASRNGVEVKILIPHKPDKKMVYLMTRSHLGQILKNGGEVYEYIPGFNHAKNIIVDNKYAFIGTVNVDYRSLLLHFECGTLIGKSNVVNEMNEDFLKAISLSKQFTYNDFKERSLIERFFAFILMTLSPLL